MLLFNNRGFILPLVLLFLQVISLLSFYLLVSTQFESKMSRQQWQKERFNESIEPILQAIEAQLTANNHFICEISVTSLDVLASQPLSWWKAQSCAGNFQTIQYYYVIERLDEDPCANIGEKEQDVLYFRVTVLSLDSFKGLTMLAQTTDAEPSLKHQSCSSLTHRITPGRQSWRLVE